ncbi:Major facilitator superfamily [Trinorchestia longiramus]|nr:Major facilitator superfamily [Trinorchestia longiramus]
MSRYTNRQIATLLIIALADFCSAICISLQAPFYPAEAESKGATATEYGLVFGVFELVVFIISPIYGEHLSTIGAKFMFNAGIFVTGSTCILFGFLNHVQDTRSFVTLSFMVRIVEALGNAGFLTAAFSIIAKEFSDNVGATFAALETCFGVGLIVGPTVGGALYEVGGYTLPFVCMGSLLLVAATTTLFLLPSPEGPAELETHHGGSQLIQLFKIPPITLAAFSIIAASISIGFVQATLEPHLRPLDLTPLQTGLVFVLNGASYALSAPIWGKLCDKGVPANIITLIGSITVVVAFLFLGPAPFLPLKESLGMCIGALILHGIGFGAMLVSTFSGAHKDAILHGMPDNIATYGLVSGMWTSTFALGAFIGPSCGGALLDYFGFNYASMFIVGLHCLVAALIILCGYCCSQTKHNNLYTNLNSDEYTEDTRIINRRSWDSTYGSLNSEPSSRSTSNGDSRESLTLENILK